MGFAILRNDRLTVHLRQRGLDDLHWEVSPWDPKGTLLQCFGGVAISGCPRERVIRVAFNLLSTS